MITEFYAVTAYFKEPTQKSTSLYKITLNSDNSVTVKKIGLKGKSSFKLNSYLKDGYFLEITRRSGMIRFSRTGQARAEDVNTKHWGEGTSPIVGLFEDPQEALDCYSSEDLKHWDKRYINSTEKVLLEIGIQTNQTIILDGAIANAIKAGELRECLR